MSVTKNTIDNLEELLNYFGLTVDQINLFNKYLYKGTTCGASISIETPDGEWHHNGDNWTGITEAVAFTIQTIVEGSDATVDSEIFEFPVAMSKIDTWLQDMEAEARYLWEIANYEYYFIKDNGESVGTITLTWDGAEAEKWGEANNIPLETIKIVAIDEFSRLNDYPEKVELPPIEGKIYLLEKYIPMCY